MLKPCLCIVVACQLLLWVRIAEAAYFFRTVNKALHLESLLEQMVSHKPSWLLVLRRVLKAMKPNAMLLHLLQT